MRIRATYEEMRTQEEDLSVAVAEEARVYLAEVLHTVNAYGKKKNAQRSMYLVREGPSVQRFRRVRGGGREFGDL